MSKKLLVRICAVTCALSGVMILVWIIFPIVKYRIENNVTGNYMSGVPETQEYLDDTKASNWFPSGKRAEDFGKSSVGYYTISIPTLRIKDATVSIGGEDLSESLIQYPGTALPGQKGNTTIFGHSVLPAFYNPKDYHRIFSTLPTIKDGDLVEVEYDGVSYRYKVESKAVVKPTDLSILEQDLSDSFLTLVTCVPPGDPSLPLRQVIRARIIPLTVSYGI